MDQGLVVSRRGFLAGASAWVALRGNVRGLLAAPVAAAKKASGYINPLIGASAAHELGEGKTFPGPATPFGMVQLGPDTITGGDNAAGYSYEMTSIEGFSFTRMSGVGWYGDFGNLQVMPTTGPMKLDAGRIGHSGEGWRSAYSHATEKAEANYYAVTLEDYGVRVEATAAARSGMLQFTYSKKEPDTKIGRVQLNLARRIGGTSTRQWFKVVGDRTVEGWMKCPNTGGGWGSGKGDVSYTVYFTMAFSKPFAKYGAWKIDVPDGTFPYKSDLMTDYFDTEAYRALVKSGQVLDGVKELEGNHIGFFAEFPVHKNGETVLLKSGISFVSLEGARKNLASDIDGWDFETVRRKGTALWDEALNVVEIEGATETQKAIFTTALYHSMIDPRAIADVDGNFTGADGKITKAEGYTQRTIFSGWDVFRGCFPLMTLLNATMINDEVNSLLALAETTHKGYLERWEIMNAYSGCMDGDPATSVILDAYQKGIRGFNVEKAYAACRQTAAGKLGATNRPQNEFYMEKGYVPDQISWTLDNCYFDWCVGTMAAAMGKTEEAAVFHERAANYKKIYDPAVGSMRAKDMKGDWIEWKGKTAFGQGCVESNPGQQSWFVPHDVAGLIALRGGVDAFTKELEDFFEKTPDTFAWNDYYNHSNEPVHHVPYLFTYAGKPWLTQKWVRKILTNAYRDEVNGIVGNDDVGQMSAWYVLGAMGFYPVCPGDDVYILGSPLFAKVTLQLDKRWYKGAKFTVTAANQSAENVYIQSADLNGKPLSRAWIRHQEIAAGGELRVVMGPRPNKEWGTRPEDLPPSMSTATAGEMIQA